MKMTDEAATVKIKILKAYRISAQDHFKRMPESLDSLKQSIKRWDLVCTFDRFFWASLKLLLSLMTSSVSHSNSSVIHHTSRKRH